MKGLSVASCKGKKCLAICHVWLGALVARIAPVNSQPRKIAKRFPRHIREMRKHRVFIFRLFFNIPRKTVAGFLCGVLAAYKSRNILNFFVCLSEFLKFLKLVVKSSLGWHLWVIESSRTPWNELRERRELLFKLTFCCLLLSAFCPLSLSAPVFTSSSSGRFVVMGPESGQNARITRLAEETASQIEDLLKMPIPATRMNPVEIWRPESGLSQEDLVRVVITRIVETRRQAAGLPRMELRIPAWFTFGLAGNLDKGMLARHRQVLSGSGGESGMKTVGEVLGWIHVPEDGHGRQAQCGLVTAWLLSLPGGLEKILSRLTTQEPVSPEWVSRTVVGVESVGAMEGRWQTWRARQDRTIQEFGALSVDLIQDLKDAIPLSGTGTPLIRPDEAIGLRKGHPEVMGLVSLKIQQIRALTMGKAPELVEAGERYCYFYEGLLRGSWGFVLRRRLARAESSLDKLETLTRAREAYLDEFEKEFTSASAESPEDHDAPLRSVLEKSRMELYVDEAERRLDKP